MTLYPLFLDLRDRAVLVVGAGAVGAHKALALRDAGARVSVVAPRACPAVVAAAAEGRLTLRLRPFRPDDLDAAWLVVAATDDPAVNAAVAAAAEERRLFVNAVDDPASASAYAASTLQRGPLTVALSSGGRAPGLCRLLREALDHLLPDADEVTELTALYAALRDGWRRERVPMAERFGLLLAAVGRRAALAGGPS